MARKNLFGPLPLDPTVEIGRGSFFLSMSTRLYTVFWQVRTSSSVKVSFTIRLASGTT